jgi:hypothetical protein
VRVFGCNEVSLCAFLGAATSVAVVSSQQSVSRVLAVQQRRMARVPSEK